MKTYKVFIRKEGNKRGTTKYIASDSIENVEKFTLDQLICKRYNVDFADYAKMGQDPQIDYIVNSTDHLVAKFCCELGLNNPIDFFYDIKQDESGHQIDIVSSVVRN